jgi:voltage-gated sodium channel
MDSQSTSAVVPEETGKATLALKAPEGHDGADRPTSKGSQRSNKDKGGFGIHSKGLFGFTDPQTVKEQVKQSLEKREPYSVFQYYKDEADSYWPRIAKHPVFENTTLAVIAINAAYIAIDTDWNKAEPLTPSNTFPLEKSGTFFFMMENLFCCYFTFEWVCRFMSFKRKLNGLKDGWFVFDSVLVFMMVMETWVMLIVIKVGGGGSPLGGTSILRLFRLLRLSRLMRMLRSLPELMILIKGMVTAMKSVAYVMALLVLLTYVFAIAFTQLAVDTPTIGDDYFANIPLSMYSLLIYATLLDDLVAFTDALRAESPAMLVLALIYIALAALTVMNMLIGVLCEVVSAVAENERDEIKTETLAIKMHEVVGACDKDKNRLISYKEFTEIVANPEGLAALEDVGVSPVGLVDFAEMFFFEDGEPVELTFEKFMEMVLELRETNTVTVKDILNCWMKIKSTTNKEIVKIKGSVEALSTSFGEKAANLGGQMDKIENMLTEGMTDVLKLSKMR